MERGGAAGWLAGMGADLVASGQRVMAIERRVLDALGHRWARQLLEAQRAVRRARQLEQERGPQLLVGDGVGQERPVGDRDVARSDIGPVDGQRDGRVDELGGQRLRLAAQRLRQRAGDAEDVRSEQADERLALADGGHFAERPLDNRPPVGALEHAQALGVDQRVERRRGELVARRALDRPGGRELLVGAEDLLDPDGDVGADGVAQTVEVAERVAQAVDVVNTLRPWTQPSRTRSRSSRACVSSNTEGSSTRTPTRSGMSKKRR